MLFRMYHAEWGGKPPAAVLAATKRPHQHSVPGASPTISGRRGYPAIKTTLSVLRRPSSENKNSACLVWHYHDDDLPGVAQRSDLSIRGLPFAKVSTGKIATSEIRQKNTANAFAAWERLGSHKTKNPTGTEPYAALERLGRLRRLGEPASFDHKGPDWFAVN